MKKILLIVALLALSSIGYAQQASGSSGGGAKTNALTTLTPSSAGSLDIGSTSKWFQDLYFGHSGSFYAKAIITPTANRTITFPDADITVAGSAGAMTSGRAVFTTTGGLTTTNANFSYTASPSSGSPNLKLTADATTSVPLLIQLLASQTGNAIEVRNSANTATFSVDSAGRVDAARLSSSLYWDGYQLAFSFDGVNSQINLAPSTIVAWSGSGNSTASKDTSLKRLSGGIVKAANGSTGAGYFAVGTDANPCVVRAGSGTPEGAVTGNVCDIFLRTDGSTSTTLYVKTSGTGNTGWTAK